MVFAQENQRGLHYDYNAYWPFVLEELMNGQTATLSAPMVNGAPDGNPDGGYDYSGTRFGPMQEERIGKRAALGFAALIAFAATICVSCSNSDSADEDLMDVVHSNGLTLRSERILGLDSSASNPLVLTPIITGEEPFTLSYKVPVHVDVSTKRCELKLLDNGKLADAYIFTKQTNDGYILDWTTIFAESGHHDLQVMMRIPFHTNVCGPSRREMITNLVRFDPSATTFGSRLWIHGFLSIPSADYRIAISDTNKVLLKNISGHTEKGVIDEIWDLRSEDNDVRRDEQLGVLVFVTPTVKDTNGIIRSNGPTVSVPYH